MLVSQLGWMQVATLHRAVQADVCKQLEIAQKAHEAKKAAGVQWCLHPTPQVHIPEPCIH